MVADVAPTVADAGLEPANPPPTPPPPGIKPNGKSCEVCFNPLYSRQQKYCYDCRDEYSPNRVFASKYYYQVKARGFCVICRQGPAADGKVYCRPCLDLHNKHGREANRRRKVSGQCRRCSLDAKPGYTFCPEHNEENTLRSRQNERRRRAESRAAGVCTRCKAAVTDGTLHCPPCKEVKREAYRRSMAKRKAEAWTEPVEPITEPEPPPMEQIGGPVDPIQLDNLRHMIRQSLGK